MVVLEATVRLVVKDGVLGLVKERFKILLVVSTNYSLFLFCHSSRSFPNPSVTQLDI